MHVHTYIVHIQSACVFVYIKYMCIYVQNMLLVLIMDNQFET